MKLAPSLVGAVVLSFAGTASAQPRTPDYVEQKVGGDQFVKFTGDELAAAPGGPYGDIIRPFPGVIRAGLIRPRVNFVSELLKSVENL
jgi:hypothetical protein